MNPTDELVQMNQRLLDAIMSGDWKTYESLCAADLTAFEPEARGQLVEGLRFHRFYFEGRGRIRRRQATMASPRVRWLGQTAIVTYVRINQIESDERTCSQAFEETRVWHQFESGWKLVHFHRSVIESGNAQPRA